MSRLKRLSQVAKDFVNEEGQELPEFKMMDNFPVERKIPDSPGKLFTPQLSSKSVVNALVASLKIKRISDILPLTEPHSQINPPDIHLPPAGSGAHRSDEHKAGEGRNLFTPTELKPQSPQRGNNFLPDEDVSSDPDFSDDITNNDPDLTLSYLSINHRRQKVKNGSIAP